MPASAAPSARLMSWSRFEAWLSCVAVAMPAATSSDTTISIEVAVGMAIPAWFASSFRISRTASVFRGPYPPGYPSMDVRPGRNAGPDARLAAGLGIADRGRAGLALRPALALHRPRREGWRGPDGVRHP